MAHRPFFNSVPNLAAAAALDDKQLDASAAPALHDVARWLRRLSGATAGSACRFVRCVLRLCCGGTNACAQALSRSTLCSMLVVQLVMRQHSDGLLCRSVAVCDPLTNDWQKDNFLQANCSNAGPLQAVLHVGKRQAC